MLGRMGAALRRGYQWLYPVRSLYLRSRGRVRYVSLSRPFQAFVSLVLIIALGWVAFASINFGLRNQILGEKNAQISGLQASFQDVTNELRATRLRFISVAGELESKHNHMVALLQQKIELEQQLDALSANLRAATKERDAASLEGDQLGHDLREQRAALAARIAALQESLASSEFAGSALSSDLKTAHKKIASVESVRESLLVAQTELSGRLDNVMGRLDRLRGYQQTFVSRILKRTESDITSLEATIAMTGLDPAELLSDSGNSADIAQGGPFLAFSDAPDFLRPGWNEAVAFEQSVIELEYRLRRWEGLQSIVEILPMATPADNFYVSSKFGRRRDPITKRWAFHGGVDMAGPPKTSIYATAGGTVAGVSSRGPYGKSVLIDHGMGLKTRYGHLNQILVNTGQTVDFREKIGRMGSTGRSTGTHLHYEVIFNGKPLDPANFMKAGTYVFKN